jgi:hypothetical protein
MTDSSLSDLDPVFQPLATQMMAEGNAAIAPSNARIIITWRSAQDQQAAKAHGASLAGPGQSPHNCCQADGTPAARAFDYAVFDENGAYVSVGADSRYATIGMIAVNLKQVWGGNWSHGIDQNGNPFDHRDYDHVEMADWKTA